MGILRTMPGSYLSPAMKIRSFASVQPAYLRVFGGESGNVQLAQNMVPNGAPAGIIGTPTIGANYLTCVGGGVSGLALPVAGNASFTAMIAAACPTFTASNQAQLLGNYSPTQSMGAKLEFDATSLFGYGGNNFANMGYLQGYVNGAPLSWKMYCIQINPNTGATQANATLAVGEITDNPTLATSTHGGDITAAFLPSSLQLGTYASSTEETAPVNIALCSVWNSILSSADIATAYSQFKSLLLANNGISV